MWQEVPSRPDMYFTVPNMSSQINNAQSMISRLQDNNIYFMSHSKNDQGLDSLYVYAITERSGELVVGEITIGQSGVVI